MKKYVCYFMTRNVYRDVLPSLKSLLKNGNVDRVYLVTEDDDVGFELPGNVTVMRVDRYSYFQPSGPNYYCRWTYMTMMKTAVPYLFPRNKRILTLDFDTIVRGDISALWELPIDDCYFAGAREPYWTRMYQRDYVNAGVIMWNLDRMRDNGMAMTNRVIETLNEVQYAFPEQDALNELCQGKIYVMDAAYNAGDWTEAPQSEIRIRHYMASKGTWRTEAEMEAYRRMPWDEVLKGGRIK